MVPEKINTIRFGKLIADIVEHRYASKSTDKGAEKISDKGKIKVTYREYMQVMRAIADSAYAKLDSRREVGGSYNSNIITLPPSPPTTFFPAPLLNTD